jgi:peptidoglycan hydrolase-like protein with peptidoglycan-binding domain
MARRKKKSAMTATTLSRLPLLAGSVAAASLGRAGLWAVSHYMRAPLASTGLLAMVTLTALAASNALYFQTARHPAPFFATSPDVPVSVVEPLAVPAPMPAPMRQSVVPAPVATETTGSLPAMAPPVVPAAPVGNAEAFAVQKKLTELGLFNGTVDGFYGPMTASAIRAFETRNGMTPTGAMSRDVIDAILRADAAGVVQAATQVAVAPPAPVVQPAPVIQPTPVTPPTPQADVVVARIASLSPVDQAVDTIGNAAAVTIDSIVAAVDGRGGNTPPTPASRPVPAASLPQIAPVAQPMPAPVQVASLEPMAAPRPAEVAQTATAPVQVANVAPANNVQLVSQIQRGLASLGFYHGSIDGHPGDATARAIREFENFHSYKVTGQVKPDLVSLLRQAGAEI